MNKLVSILFLLISFFNYQTVAAQPDDDNIIIANKDVEYEYFIEKGSVVIKEKYTAEYESVHMKGDATVYETYNNESEINKVKVKGIKLRDPLYRQYRSNDIFYSDAKICEIALTFDKKGKTGSVEFEKTIRNPRYFTVIPLSEEFFIKNETVRIIVPSWMKVELVDYNFGENIKKELLTNGNNTQQTYIYSIENMEAIVDEKQMQGPTFIYPHILVLNKSAEVEGTKTTYFETLADQYNWYKYLMGLMNNDKNIIADKAKEITANSTNGINKIRDIYAWVQTNIRYVAFEDGIAGFKPDDAQEVLRKKYGDCKGMANLTKELLKSQGIDARLTWIGTNHIAHDYSTPNLSVDNHMICTAFHGDKTYYLDATYEYMPLGEYPQSIQGRQVMIEDGDKFILNRIPVSPPQLNTDSLYCQLTVNKDAITGTAVRYFMGESKETILSLINATPKDKVDEALRVFLTSGNIQDKTENVTLNDATPKTDATYLTYRIESKAAIQQHGEELYIGLNQIQDLDNAVIDTKKRKSDLLLNYRYRLPRQVELTIPDGYSPTHIPESMLIEQEGYLFRISYSKNNKSLDYSCEIVIKNPLVKKAMFQQWNSDIQELKKNYKEQVILQYNK